MPRAYLRWVWGRQWQQPGICPGEEGYDEQKGRRSRRRRKQRRRPPPAAAEGGADPDEFEFNSEL